MEDRRKFEICFYAQHISLACCFFGKMFFNENTISWPQAYLSYLDWAILAVFIGEGFVFFLNSKWRFDCFPKGNIERLPTYLFIINLFGIGVLVRFSGGIFDSLFTPLIFLLPLMAIILGEGHRAKYYLTMVFVYFLIEYIFCFFLNINQITIKPDGKMIYGIGYCLMSFFSLAMPYGSYMYDEKQKKNPVKT